MTWSWDLLNGIIDAPTALIAAAVALFAVAYAPRRARALVIWITQYAAFLAIALTAAVAGRHGYTAGRAMAQTTNEMGQLYYGVAGAAVGGILGFVAAALVVSVFFVLMEIRDNTRG
jgi:glucan phosphoethanolaminetransferase (alkaline phosphatase superfamily)